jgi:perosamine synthetase
MIQIYKPYISKRTKEFVNDAVESSWISSSGRYKHLSCEFLKDKLNVRNVLLTSNGTTATHLVAKSLLYKHPDIDTILVPNNVYVAAWNSFVYDRKLNLVPVKADLDTWNYDLKDLAKKIHSTKQRIAVLVVPNLGNIINLPKLMRQYPDVVFLEDNCEGLFGTYEGTYSGTASLASSLSFYGNKTITSGEGGAVLTNNDDLYMYLEKIHGQGQSEKQRYVHDVLGYNYRMTNVAAAILYGQLLDSQEIIEKKEELFDFYLNNIKNIDGIEVQKIEDDTTHSKWMMGVKTNLEYEKVKDFLTINGIETRPMFYPMSVHKHLKRFSIPEEEKEAILLNRNCFMIPSHPEVSKEDRQHIIQTLQKLTKLNN